jgi:hypothetical protein
MRLVRRFSSPALRALALVLVLGAFACNDPSPPADDPDIAHTTIPTVPPDIRGVITSATVTAGRGLGDSRGRVLVEAVPGEASGSAKAMVSWTGTTRIFRRDGTPVTADELARGVTVSAWFTGPVAESYPVQARARVIVVE